MGHYQRPALPARILCLVTDLELAGGVERLIETVASATQGGVNMVQVRAKGLPEDELKELARRLMNAIDHKALTVVNGSVQVAIDSHASAVHLPEHAREAAETTDKAHENGLLVGRSVHSADSAARAAEEGADYLIAGTVFASRSHPEGPVCGLEGLTEMVEAADGIPVIGIGGISTENALRVIQAGASGVAVISAIIGVSYPLNSARLLSAAISGT